MQHVRTNLDFHVRHGFNLESIWIAAGPVSAKHDPLLQVGQSWEILKALYDTLKSCVLLAMSKDFCVRLGLVPNHAAHIRFVLGPTSAADAGRCRTRTKLSTLNPLASQSAAIAPCWTLVWPKLEPAAGLAQVPLLPALRPRTAKFDPSRLWLGHVHPLLSYLSNSLGAGDSRREASPIKPHTHKASSNLCCHRYLKAIQSFLNPHLFETKTCV